MFKNNEVEIFLLEVDCGKEGEGTNEKR